MEEKLYPCRHCKSELDKRYGRCPYCGTLNPTVKVKEIIKTTVIIVILMFFYTLYTK